MDWMWYSVETPSVFSEIKLPANDGDMTRRHWQQYRRLQRLAQDYGTHIVQSSHRRG